MPFLQNLIVPSKELPRTLKRIHTMFEARGVTSCSAFFSIWYIVKPKYLLSYANMAVSILSEAGTFMSSKETGNRAGWCRLDFPIKRESVEAFFSDPEYQPLKELRQRVAKTDIVMVEGL